MIQHFNNQSKKLLNKKVLYIPVACIFFQIATLPLLAQYSVKDIDSLELQLNTPSLSEHDIYVTYQALIAAYQHTNREKSLEYVHKGLNLAEKTKNYYYFTELYFNAANIHYYMNQLDSALYCFEQALAMHALWANKGYFKEDLDYVLMRIYVGFASIHYTSGKYDLVLENYYKALEMADKMNLTFDAAFISMSIADIYKHMSNIRQAEIYYLKAEELFRELSDSLGIARIYYKMCDIKIIEENYQKAVEYGEESFRILSAMPNVRAVDIYSSVRCLSDVWLKIQDYDKALEYALKSLEYARLTNRPDGMATSFGMLAQCYLKQEKYKEAEETAFMALAADSNKIQINTALYQIIAESNIWLKNSEKAIEYLHKAIEYKNIYLNQNFQSSISEMEVKYNTEKKEMQIAALKEKNALMMWIIVAGGGVLLLSLVALFFLWLWTVQKRRLAESYIKQVEQEKQIVATQSVFDGEVKERTRLARDLHDGLGGKLTAMKIHLEKLKQTAGFDNTKEEQYNVVMDILDDSVQEMRRVSHNLMPETLSHAGLKPAVDEFCRSMSSQIIFKYYGDETRLDLKLEALIYRIIHELVNNALKYAAASQIMVQIVQEPDTIFFTVQDNGRGFDTTAQTDGMGLQSIRTRVASFGGDIQIDSKMEVGTEVNVELKIDSSASLLS